MWIVLVICMMFSMVACNLEENSDRQQQTQQEQILKDISSQTGMPAIKNAREKKFLKLIYELRDREDYVTYTYMENMQPSIVRGVTSLGGKLVFVGQTIGYPIPYSTQYTNPQKVEYRTSAGVVTLPQADPNGLFSPASSDATWILMRSPDGEVKPVYSEPKLFCSPFKLPVD